jgi:hypothetical protein
MAFDTTRLVAQMTIKGSLPDGRFTDQELMDFAYDALLSDVVPAILDAREDYYVRTLDYTITANQGAYDIPPRSLYSDLREVKIIRGTKVVDLDRIDLEDVKSTETGTPWAFYIAGNQVNLYPTPDQTVDTLRVFYCIRPGSFVSTAECARITAISGNDLSVTIPSGWTTADTFDLIKGRGGFDILDFDLSATGVTGGTITLTNSPPSTLIVGDYICLAEQTCLPFVMPEAQVALIQFAVATALESMGDAGAEVMAKKAESLKTKFQTEIKTRVQGAPKQLGRRLL